VVEHGLWNADGGAVRSAADASTQGFDTIEGAIMSYGISKTANLSYDQAVLKVTEELQKEGFGILTTIDVKETLKKKLNVDFKKYVILGACNPPFAYEALSAELDFGLLLPCNVIVYEQEGRTVVATFDPTAMLKHTDNPTIARIAAQAKERLERVINSL
jgi:uncharacterized protein (DUF302 family)